ncbi:MAG TPA: DHH family phosphoesterase [Candidatus Brocadiia bacterium]|nr:bifunctional oligoribonuclease/PAP phosphatase NrnA [Planctomycetota bacterium]MDO8092201.1 bifunctional oligoribonuclease/PAP phosphatase NrnA [Candidatus Brocadiales bacterium]
MWNKIKNLIKDHKRFLVTTHKSPEGDAIGSAVALKEFLKALGKDVVMVNYDTVPSPYRFLDEFEGEWIHTPSKIKEKVDEAEVIFILDVAGDKQLGPLAELIKDSKIIKVRIDHHHTNDVFADLSVVDENVSATGELIYSLIKSMRGKISQKMANAIYLAISTDTGWFRFTNTSAKVFNICKELLSASGGGVNGSYIYEKVFQSKSWDYIDLLKLVLSSVQKECDGRLAWFKLTKDMLKSSRIKHVDTEPLMDLIRAVEMVEVIILFREQARGRVKVSFRSKHDVDVSQLAAQYNGGGGHRRAAGVIIPGTMDDVVEKIIDITKQALK